MSLQGIRNKRPSGDQIAPLSDLELGRLCRFMMELADDGQDNPWPTGKVHLAHITSKKQREEQRVFTDRILRGLVSCVAIASFDTDCL